MGIMRINDVNLFIVQIEFAIKEQRMNCIVYQKYSRVLSKRVRLPLIIFFVINNQVDRKSVIRY